MRERDMNMCVHVVVHGIVQGVNFRYATRRTAHSLLVMGWVRNRPDGTVEVLAEGPRPQLERLVGFLRRGPSSARVESLDLEWRQATGAFVSFDIT